MFQAARRIGALGLAAACGAALLGCQDSKAWKDHTFGIDSAPDANPKDAGVTPDAAIVPAKDADAPNGTGNVAANELPCIPAVASDHLRARDSVMVSAATAGMAAGASGMFTRDLFNLFRSNCGACHVDQNSGGFHTGLMDFSEKLSVEAIHRLTSDDPGYFMPPPAGGGKPFSSRGKDDPIVELASLLEAWLAQGKPADVFYPPSATHAEGTVSYLLLPAVGSQMTNLANCVPDKKMVGMEGSKSAELDAMFEKATTLPERLEQTDLVSLDASALARSGVVAFAPAYTLWADNAKKIRMVRRARGKSIAFDKATQSFSIPANTRFYKTFLKHVVDLQGHESYRKMETRLIVSRPDQIMPDGSRQATALFGTYAWNEQETEAVLVRDPLRNGKPFRDRLVTYITDEEKADSVIAEGPADLQKALEAAGVTRTYAIPGSERCIQCHMGSPGASFILGFTPLQIHRRPTGQGGVIEPADRDELNQLQRLIDYGVISGMTSPDDVTLLEDSQGDRKPRNVHELEAQGYMVGNCAHCHNPYGFPSVSAPELKNVLNFMPSSVGGIFQFPLDKVSPRIFRGEKQNTRIPYITPSIWDHGETDVNQASKTYRFVGGTSAFFMPAPWRSLIYRNVDTPYSYVDDSAIFPHMPRNTAGYDCRARRILGTWMLSIPARPQPEIERQLIADQRIGAKNPTDDERTLTALLPVPYVEARPGEADYNDHVREAAFRVDDFQASPRYKDCPTGAPSLLPGDSPFDIQDPKIRDNPDLLAPTPVYVNDGKVEYGLATPARPHWFVTDLTDAPGDWGPRRADWRDIIVAHREDMYRAGEKQVVDLLGTLHVTGNDELREFALTDVPFGLWVEKKECAFPASVKKVAEISTDQRPQWMSVADSGAATESAHVYDISPGAQLFTAICRNCHGPQADAKSRLADTIADLTGGATRVGNLRDGLFGPVSTPGANRLRVFGAGAGDGLSADDWAARYLAWMTLGGTRRVIPEAVLNLVSNTLVLGEHRSGTRSFVTGSANMLKVAQFLCEEVLPIASAKYFDPTRGSIMFPKMKWYSSALVYKNGDREMWERLCSLQNPLPVRVVTANMVPDYLFPISYLPAAEGPPKVPAQYDLYRRANYGSQLVGDHLGKVRQGIDAGNLAPWCIRKPTDPDKLKAVENYWAENFKDGSLPPYCPADFLAEPNRMSEAELTRWTQRGAMNAGLSVFLYLDALAKGEKHPVPEYDHCEDLEKK